MLSNAHVCRYVKAVDGIMHVMRAFEDADVIHVEDRVDPVEDIEIITSELRIKDIEYMTSIREKLNKDANRMSQNPQTAKAHKVGLCTLNQVDPQPITYSLSNP